MLKVSDRRNENKEDLSLNIKPDYVSYLKRQPFKPYSHIIRSKDGKLYKEINGESHRAYLFIIWFCLFLFVQFIAYKINIGTNSVLLIILGLFMTIIFSILYFVLSATIVYKISEFEVLDEIELEKFKNINL